MSEGPKQNAPDGSHSGGSEGRLNRALDLMKPCWPAALPLPPSKDVACFIPENLAVILSREAFEQLFGYAYSTTTEISCLGTVRQEGERFRIERFYLVPQSSSVGHTELDQEAVAALVENLLAHTGVVMPAEAHCLPSLAIAIGVEPEAPPRPAAHRAGAFAHPAPALQHAFARATLSFSYRRKSGR